MTVIAYKDGIIAGDRYAISHRIVVSNRQKIGRSNDGTLHGASGNGAQCETFHEWIKIVGSEATFLDPPFAKHPRIGVIIILPDRRIHLIETEDDEIHREWYGTNPPFAAIGIGTELALGAMAAGADAIEAVRIACQFHVDCGGGIDWLNHDGKGGHVDG